MSNVTVNSTVKFCCCAVLSLLLLCEIPEDHLGVDLASRSCTFVPPATATWEIIKSDGDEHVRLRWDAQREALLNWHTVRHNLGGRRIAFVGDSVTRFQYLNLVHFLAHGAWYSLPPIFEYRDGGMPWSDFFEDTSRRLVTATAREMCDCVREGENDAHENRIFEDSEADLSIAFYFYFHGYSTGGWDTSNLTLTRCIEFVGCLQGGCAPGTCSGTPHWVANNYAELLEHVVSSFDAEVIIFNSGLWPGSGFTSHERIRGLLDLAVSLRKHGVKDLIWKTSARTAFPLNDSRVNQENGWPLQPGRPERSSLVPALEHNESGWRIFDTYLITSSLHDAGLSLSRIYFDQVHFTADINRGLNEALLLELTPFPTCEK